MKTKKLKNTNNARAFTLVELLIFMAIFSTILVVLTTLFAAIVQQQLETQGVSAVESDTTFLGSRFQYDFSRADVIILPAEQGDESSSLTLDINGEDVTYALSGSTLQLTTLSGTEALSSPRTVISDLSFRRVGNESGVPTIHLQMTITSVSGNTTGNETRIIDTILGLR